MRVVAISDIHGDLRVTQKDDLAQHPGAPDVEDQLVRHLLEPLDPIVTTDFESLRAA